MQSKKSTKYISKQADEQGFVQYTDEENSVWHDLFVRQMKLLANRADQAFLDGIEKLQMNANRIPQIPEVNEKLYALTGWQITPVSALIDFDTFFKLLSSRKFPAATFIRTREEIDYLQEPDIFHEIFGHCPLLTLPAYADFTYQYAQLGLNANAKDRAMLARLYWFTIEFGLIQTLDGLRIYGGGILSSYGETQYCLDSKVPILKHLDALEAFRTPYRIDIMQPQYFIIQDYSKLYDLMKLDLMALIQQARELGMHPPLFEPKNGMKPEEQETKFC